MVWDHLGPKPRRAWRAPGCGSHLTCLGSGPMGWLWWHRTPVCLWEGMETPSPAMELWGCASFFRVLGLGTEPRGGHSGTGAAGTELG